MWIAVQSVLSILVVVLIGFWAGKKNIVSKELSHALATLVMSFTFPALLFTLIADCSVKDIINLKFIFVFFLALMMLYFLIFFIHIKILKRNRQDSAMAAFACSFPNMAFMGIPYLTEILGNDSLISVAIGNVITSVFMIPITIFFLQGDTGNENIFKKEVFNLMGKPLIIAPILGIIVSFIQFPIPYFLMHGLKILGEATCPLALFTFGLMTIKFKFSFSKDSLMNIGVKLFIQPFIAIFLILIFKLSGYLAMEIIILTAMPTAVIVSMFAEKYDTYKKETVNAIIGGSVLSVVTLVLFTVLAGYF